MLKGNPVEFFLWDPHHRGNVVRRLHALISPHPEAVAPGVGGMSTAWGCDATWKGEARRLDVELFNGLAASDRRPPMTARSPAR